MASQTAKSAFIHALTATDQLNPSERKRHADMNRSRNKNLLRSQRYEAWMRAKAAFHLAMGTTELACMARVRGHADKEQWSTEELAQVRAFIAIADQFMSLPFVNREDHKAREVLVRKWGECARTVVTSPLYNTACKRWTTYLQANAPEGR
ncbi:hypothetical protein [Sphingomonas sp. GM_Shp_1]|uniref:hypothetical protein n=1 Tax=Sphingomonas sp. GM_Shp_1 TaxID=2937381 RepID=UPI00226B7840|nr:hypothetical protein [Sphingomonas sp. GM_Shp_1]